jgi:hypothetical protein
VANVNILGMLNSSDSDYVKLHTYGQGVIYDALTQILGNHNNDVAEARTLFVSMTTWMFQDVYKLEGYGRLQRRGVQSRPGEVKAAGEWTVGYPLEDFGAAIGISTVDWAYMDAREFNRHVGTVLTQDLNTHRFEILKAYFNNTARAFIDLGKHFPDTTVQPLANGDSVLYPPVVGSEVPSTSNNYLGVPAAATTITDANNPIPAMVNQLEQRFGTPTGGSDIVIFCNNAQTLGIQGLAGFTTVPNRFVTYGDLTNLVVTGGIPIRMGRVLGETNSALIVEWRWIPAGYLLGIHAGAPPALALRTDPPDTGLTTGLQMKAQDEEFPFLDYAWTDRFGYGVANRLNGVVMDLTAAGGASTYSIPVGFT